MKEIALTKGQVALVDDDIYEYLMQWKWFALKGGKTYYAARQQAAGKRKQKTIHMHREVIRYHQGECPDKEVDHKDHNGLNNTYTNLRYVTRRQNAENQRNNTSGYPGVSYHKQSKKFRAYTRLSGRQITIGTFGTPHEAHTARINYLQERGIA